MLFIFGCKFIINRHIPVFGLSQIFSCMSLFHKILQDGKFLLKKERQQQKVPPLRQMRKEKELFPLYLTHFFVPLQPQTEMHQSDIIRGSRDGIPIALGYFAVAFSLGIIAKQAGLTAAIGFVSSFFTRASAGEYGVYTLVAAQATYVEIVAMCLVANLRYMLMSAALSQKMAPGTSWYHRVLMACCVTDEVFGISIARKGYCPPAYTYSAALVSTVFWASGCAAGIVAGGLLPSHIVAALSVALYGMFLAIIMPPARDDRHVLYAVAASFLLSGVCSIAPVVSSWSNGTRTIVLTIVIAAVVAWLKPIETEQTHGQA